MTYSLHFENLNEVHNKKTLIVVKLAQEEKRGNLYGNNQTGR